MSKKNKKDNNGFEDIKPEPYVSSSRLMKDDGVFPVMTRSRRKMRMDNRIRKGVAGGLVAFLGISMLSSIYSTTRIDNFKEQISSVESSSFKTRYGSLGSSIIESYYSGQASPVNLLSGANWPGVNESSQENGSGNSSSSSSQGSSNESTGPNGGAKVKVSNIAMVDGYDSSLSLSEEDTKKDISKVFSNPRKETLYYVATINGQPNRVSVQLLIPDINDTAKEPYLIGPPTIEKKYTTVKSGIEGSNPSLNPKMFTSIDLSEESTKTVSDWASAIASNDESQLKRIVGDNNSDHKYSGIGGFQLNGTPQIDWSYEFTKDFGDGKKNYLVARVTYMISTQVKSSKDSSSASSVTGNKDSSEFMPTQTMDILLTNYSEGTPNIVAWGGAGTWDSLSPEMNAIEIGKEQSDDSEATQTSTESNSDSGSDSFTETSTSGSSSSAPGVPTFSDDDKTKSSKKAYPKKTPHKKTSPRSSKE